MWFTKMLNKIYLKLLNIIIAIIDYPNKRKILTFLKKKNGKKSLNIIDIGAHKGETINLFFKNFNIGKIFAFEPNINLFNLLKKNFKKNDDKIKLFNSGIGLQEEELDLNIMMDSSSSTFNTINLDSNYYKKKNKIITFLSENKDLLKHKQKISIITLSNIIKKYMINTIDILKIDTEGFELNVLKGIKEADYKKIEYIYFEHHYDLMINKGYTFSDINSFLVKNNFKKIFKVKMKLRKSFEYIYEKKR